jgi:hypothetical protein
MNTNDSSAAGGSSAGSSSVSYPNVTRVDNWFLREYQSGHGYNPEIYRNHNLYPVDNPINAQLSEEINAVLREEINAQFRAQLREEINAQFRAEFSQYLRSNGR